MKQLLSLSLIGSAVLLCGCTPLLERQYSVVEAHNSEYREPSGTHSLEATGYQDLVNAILLLVSEHAEEGTVQLHGCENLPEAEQTLQTACQEVETESALGSYLLHYITFQCQEESDFIEVQLTLSYRRSEAQYRSMVQTSSTHALEDLLRLAVERGDSELVLCAGYAPTEREELLAQIDQWQQLLQTGEENTWTVSLYPETGAVEIVEILF